MRLDFLNSHIKSRTRSQVGQFARTVAATISAGLFFSVGVFAEEAEISRPIRMDQVHTISFGKLVPGRVLTGRVVIDPQSGNRTAVGDIGFLSGPYGPAKFEITGAPNASFVVELPHSLEWTPGVVLTDFKSFPTLVGHLDATGRATLQIGATLVLDAAAAPGSFSTSFDVSVGYQ